MLLSDWTIRDLCQQDPTASFAGDRYAASGPMITPFSEAVSGDGVISYGLTSAGYDLRLARGVLVFKNTFGDVVDPARFRDEAYRARMFDANDAPDYVIIPPHGYCLGMSHEALNIPQRVKGRCVGKSTYARCGIAINTTPLEPGWRGTLTVEIANHNPSPCKIYVMQGVAQVEFEVIDSVPEKDYSNKHDGRGGKYQGQTEVTPPRVL